MNSAYHGYSELLNIIGQGCPSTILVHLETLALSRLMHLGIERTETVGTNHIFIWSKTQVYRLQRKKYR